MNNNCEFQFEISIIILTYNADFEKLKKTIISAILQQGITFEIIIADDGSVVNHVYEITELFYKYGYTEYKLIMNPENKGTIHNLLSGINAADGEFSKIISSGDYLSSETVLSDWLKFCRENSCEWSFSEIIHYQMNDGNEKFVSAPSFPLYIEPYISGNKDQMRWNYLISDDIPVGCSMFTKTNLVREYLEILSKTDNLYGEDNIYRIMMYDGIVGSYYPKATLFYEYGTGISTRGSDFWTKQIVKEYIQTFRLLEQREKKDEMQIKMQKYIRKKGKPFSSLFIPGMIKRVLMNKYFPRKFLTNFESTAEWRAKCR